MTDSTRARVSAYAAVRNLTEADALEDLICAGLERREAQRRGGLARAAQLTENDRRALGQRLTSARAAKRR